MAAKGSIFKGKAFKLEGVPQLLKTVKAIGSTLAGETKGAFGDRVREAFLIPAEMIAAEARDMCPVKTGALRDSLRADKLKQRVGAIFWSQNVYYGPWVEYGSSKAVAHPFMRPAINAIKPLTANVIAEQLKKVIVGDLRQRRMARDGRDTDMIFEDVLRDLVVGFNLVGTRVFLMQAPQVPASQATFPYLVYLPVGPEPLHAHSGPLDLLQREYQFSFFGTSQSRALGLSDALRQRLDGLRGTFEGVNFCGVFYRSQTGTYEDDTRLFQSITTYFIQFRVGTLPALASRQLQRNQRKDTNQ